MFGHERRTLKELFDTPVENKTSSYFQVPMYQRKYEWEKEKQVLKLVDDVFDNLGKPYFMGPLIICSASGVSQEYAEVIDGQQRLATLAIFVRVLADYIERRKNEVSFQQNLVGKMNKIQYELTNKIVKGGLVQNIPVIHLSNKIDAFFKDQILMPDNENKADNLYKLGKGQHPSTIRLIEAYLKIWESLRQRYDSKRGEELVVELNNLAVSLLNEKVFLLIVVQDVSSAYTIFETINARGKPLTLSDLVKNLCFKKMSDETELTPRDLEEFEDDWDEAELLVSDFASFLWHVWVSRYETCPKSEVFGKLQSQTKSMTGKSVFDFATDLIFYEAQYYRCYENPMEEENEAKRRYLHMLRTMDATRCYPLLLGIDYAEHKTGAVKEKDTLDVVRALTNLTFWHSGICNKDAKKLEKVYHDLARKARGMTKETSTVVKEEIMAKLNAEFPSLDESRASFNTRRFTDNSFVKMVLGEIEKSKYQKGETTLKGPKDVHLEHILPRTPDSSWKELFPIPSEMTDHTDRFGNYTLLWSSLNRKIKNGPFSEKKTAYAQSKVGLTQELTTIEAWDAEAINNRSEQLFKLAQEVWPLST